MKTADSTNKHQEAVPSPHKHMHNIINSKALQKTFAWLFLCLHQHLGKFLGKTCSKQHPHLASPLSPEIRK